MNVHPTHPRMFALVVTLFLSACATEPTPPAVDIVGTIAVQLASDMLTQTVAAYSPTPLPQTATPIPTETPTLEPTKEARTTVTVVGQSPCYFGPGPSYTLESYISDTKKVELIGIGSVPGWYVIMNPYFHQACWIAAENIHVDTAMDLTLYPTIVP